VQAKIIKLVGLKNGGRLSPINLVTFAGTQNGEFVFYLKFQTGFQISQLIEKFSERPIFYLSFSIENITSLLN
jgi:hypothetical protein